MEASNGMTTTRSQRIIGALLASHSGDALGSTLESQSSEAIRKRYPSGLRDIVGGGPFGLPPGQATHDTDLTRAVLLAYLDRARIHAAGGVPDVARLAANHMLNWLQGEWPERRAGRPPCHVGKSTLAGLRRYEQTGEVTPLAGPTAAPLGAAAANEGRHAGNGSLMRCIPTGLFESDLQKLVEESMAISAITHADERCTVSCAAYNTMARELVAGRPAPEAVEAGRAVAARLESEPSVASAIDLGKSLSVADMAERGPSDRLPSQASGFVLESLAIAVAAVLDPRSLEDVIIDVVRIGGDTDTNAAIAGGVLGARDGALAVPRRWTERLQFGDDFAEIATLIMRTSDSERDLGE